MSFDLIGRMDLDHGAMEVTEARRPHHASRPSGVPAAHRAGLSTATIFEDELGCSCTVFYNVFRDFWQDLSFMPLIRDYTKLFAKNRQKI